MTENVKVRWLEDNEGTKVAPKTLSSHVYNEDGTLFKDEVNASIEEINETIGTKADKSEIVQADWNQNDDTALDYVKNRTHWIEDDGETYHPLDEKFLPETAATKEYVEALYKKLTTSTALGFYCVEDVTISINGVPRVYPANSNVEISFVEGDTFEIIPTSDNSILTLTAFPGALGTYYPWLEGVKLFSNILFDMNNEDMYSKWSQGNQGSYQVQFAQYSNCIFWSDNPYISEVTRRTNYTLCSTSQLPLCYSTIPDNTFKSFYLAFNVNSDPNWSNPLYKESFANATWATQAFSYYGARMVGFPGHDSPAFNIVLPKDCRGLMFDARNIEGAGTFDATNTTNFGAKSGSWREAFGDCPSLRRLYIKNLKVSLNISWSPIDYDSISYIISAAANTSAITISVSPYTYNLLSQSDFDLAASKNITIALITTNYVEDKRLGDIANKADVGHTHDDIYYTESEIDTKFLDAANSVTEQIEALNLSTTYETKTDASAKLEEAKGYTDTKTADLVSSATVDSKITTHNTATDAHNDIRLLITELTTRLNTLADSDDTTLDQMSEVVAYIKNNKSLIEGITTSKVNVSDIIDNLTTNVADKPLSAAQGVAIKALIDALQTVVEGKAATSDLTSHTNNKANPHGVTAEQVGAATVEYVDALTKVYAQPNEPTNPKEGDIWIDTDEAVVSYAEGESF